MSEENLPVIFDASFEDGPKGTQSMVVQQYTAPASGDFDPFEAADRALAKYIAEILVKKYHGYDWWVESEIAQGIAWFRVTSLMGESLKCIINLKMHPDVPGILIQRLGGALLDRMKLPYTITPDQLAEARKRLHTFQFDDVGRRSA